LFSRKSCRDKGRAVLQSTAGVRSNLCSEALYGLATNTTIWRETCGYVFLYGRLYVHIVEVNCKTIQF